MYLTTIYSNTVSNYNFGVSILCHIILPLHYIHFITSVTPEMLRILNIDLKNQPGQ